MARGYQDYIETSLEALGGLGGATQWGYGPYVAPGNPFTVGQLFNPVVEPSRFAPARPILPEVLFPTPPAVSGPSVPAVAGPQEVSVSPVIDPDFEPAATVYEDAPGGIYETNRAETDWDWVYSQYVVLNPPREEPPLFPTGPFIPKPKTTPNDTGRRETTPDLPDTGYIPPREVVPSPAVVVAEVEEVAIDWGQIGGAIVGGFLDPFGAGQATTSFFGPQTGVPTVATPPPAKVTIDTRTGAVTVCKRRRRRRLLTSSDLADLAALKAIIGGGAAMNAAVVKAVRR